MSAPLCKDCEFFMPSDSMMDDFHKIKFGKCIKSIATINKSAELVTGISETPKAEERFNFASWERQHGDCGLVGTNFKLR
jgi:hypothetical protein